MNLLLRLPPWLATALFGLLSALTLGLAAFLLRPILGPVIAAAILYVFLAPLVEALQRRGLPHGLAVTAVLISAVGVMGWALLTLAPTLAEQLSGFIHRLPETWDHLQSLMKALDTILRENVDVGLPGDELMAAARQWLEGQAQALLSRGSQWAAQLVLWIILVPFLSFFLLRDFRRARNYLLDRIPNGAFEDVLRVYHRVGSRLEQYLRGVLIQSTVVAVVVGSGLSIVGLPLAPLLGMVAGLLNLIPYAGPLLALLFPLLVGLSAGLEPVQLGLAASALVLAQLIDNLLVVPLILARAANLHPLIALLGVIIAGRFFGALGMILALPVLASARICLVGIHEGLYRRTTQARHLPADNRDTAPKSDTHP